MDSALNLISQSSLRKGLPQFKVGQTIRIHQRIKEGEKERVQYFEGLIIKISNGTGINGTIVVRKIVDGIGVERIYPIHSPNIVKIELLKEAKVRRGKLYYMRDLTGKAARLKTVLLEGQVFRPKGANEEAEDVSADVSAESASAEEVEAEQGEAKPEEESEAETPAEVKEDVKEEVKEDVKEDVKEEDKSKEKDEKKEEVKAEKKE